MFLLLPEDHTATQKRCSEEDVQQYEVRPNMRCGKMRGGNMGCGNVWFGEIRSGSAVR